MHRLLIAATLLLTLFCSAIPAGFTFYEKGEQLSFVIMERTVTDFAQVFGKLMQWCDENKGAVTDGSGNLEWTNALGEKYIFVSDEKGKFQGKLPPATYQLEIRSGSCGMIKVGQVSVAKGVRYELNARLEQAHLNMESLFP
jgi:hypothetical protein